MQGKRSVYAMFKDENENKKENKTALKLSCALS